MVVIYLVIGVLCGLATIAFSWLVAKNTLKGHSKKAKEKRKQRTFQAIFVSLLMVIAWPFMLFLAYKDMNLRRNGSAFGLGGGGYINAKRTWMQFIKDELDGKEGEPEK